MSSETWAGRWHLAHTRSGHRGTMASNSGPTPGPHCSEGWALGQDGAFLQGQEGKHKGWVSQVTCPWTCGLPRPKLVLLTRKPSLRALAGRRDPSPRQGLAFSSLRRPLVAVLAPPKLLAQARSRSDEGRDGRWPFCSEREEAFRWFVSPGERRPYLEGAAHGPEARSVLPRWHQRS